jgi:Mn-dependent DtxR family transcriptional regulator
MKIKESAENYLETILVLSKKNGYVRSIDIATELDYSKPSVSVAMKNLREYGYITTDKDGYITLTDTGLEIALKMYERHVLITRWLVSLGVEQEIAAEDACKIEHVLSKQTFDAIKRYVDSQN